MSLALPWLKIFAAVCRAPLSRAARFCFEGLTMTFMKFVSM